MLIIIVERGQPTPFCTAKKQYIEPTDYYKKNCKSCKHLHLEKKLTVYV
ncbi:MAG: hypothetical protein QW660_08740 [Candidatus Bathyarchaeia archaeon]